MNESYREENTIRSFLPYDRRFDLAPRPPEIPDMNFRFGGLANERVEQELRRRKKNKAQVIVLSAT